MPLRNRVALLMALPAATMLVPLPALAAVEASPNTTAIITFFVFVAGTLAITAWAAMRTRSRNDFYAAGNRIGGLQNGFAIAGDFMSAAAFLGMCGLVFNFGYDVLYFIIGLTVGWLVILLLIAERLRNLGRYTFADVASLRLQRAPVRTMSACGTLGVALPYLIAQLVAAGTLMENLFGLSYTQGVVVVGVLMTLYVTFGGMLATTWVQIVKAALLLSGGTALMLMVLLRFDFSIGALAAAAVEAHPRGADIMRPGLMFSSSISVISLSLAFICGSPGLPHVLMRFFTVPDAHQARRSAAFAVGIITYFNWVVLVIGLGAIVWLVDHPVFTSGGLALRGGSNMAAIHLSQVLGGDIFLGFISAVAFATILAVVSGITLSAAAAVSHDLWANVLRHGRSTEAGELRVSRITTVGLGLIGIGLGTLFEGQNVAVLATLPLVVAASVNFPVLMLTMYWRGLTTRGAVSGGYAGLVTALVLIVLGPNVWQQALGFAEAIVPYKYPTLFSMGVGFLVAWQVSCRDRSAGAGQDRARFDNLLVQAHLGQDLSLPVKE
jgi:cation/acetate symporter